MCIDSQAVRRWTMVAYNGWWDKMGQCGWKWVECMPLTQNLASENFFRDFDFIKYYKSGQWLRTFCLTTLKINGH